MKKLFSVLLLTVIGLFTFSSCELDDNSPNFHFELLPVDSVAVPESFVMGKTYKIKAYYKRPTDCHLNDGFYYEKDLNTRTFALQAKVLERNDEITKASIHIKYSGVNQSFTTQNTKDYPHRIDLKLIDGPFKVLEGYWIFTKINEEACSIEFHLHYEFSNFILDKLISPIFSQIANTFVDGFVTQADKIYTK